MLHRYCHLSVCRIPLCLAAAAAAAHSPSYARLLLLLLLLLSALTIATLIAFASASAAKAGTLTFGLVTKNLRLSSSTTLPTVTTSLWSAAARSPPDNGDVDSAAPLRAPAARAACAPAAVESVEIDHGLQRWSDVERGGAELGNALAAALKADDGETRVNAGADGA